MYTFSFHYVILALYLLIGASRVLANEAIHQAVHQAVKERAFYALSSLRYSIEEKNSSSIHFSKEEVNSLWETACLEPSIQEELESLRIDYDHTLANQESFKTGGQELEKLWHSLQRSILQNALTHPKDTLVLKRTHPHLEHNPHLDKRMKKRMKPYWIPWDHPLVSTLDRVFSRTRVLTNEHSFADAGFVTLFAQPMSYIRVARHPLLPGYLLKVYLDCETRKKNGIPGWEWLLNRCQGAENIRNLIKRKKLRHFAVPDKWIYPLPSTPPTESGQFQQPIILLVEDMELVSEEETRYAWKNKITKRHLHELFCIFSHGYSSTYLAYNIPYSKSGKFACIDTEHPKRKLAYDHAKPYFSEEMQEYWDKLVKMGGKI